MDKITRTLESKFNELIEESFQLIQTVPEEKLFQKPTVDYLVFSVGEYILRSVGRVEQTFGGITSRLWDDPFEWTLPEELSTHKKIFEYIEEVEATRKKGFEIIKSDEDLYRELPAPEKIKSLFEVLFETLIDAEKLQAQAKLVLRLGNKD